MVIVHSFSRLVPGVFTLALVSACGLTGPSPPAPETYSVSGVITGATPDGNVPIGGVIVEESQTQRQVTSFENGFYNVTGLRPGSVSLRIIKPPFVPIFRTVVVNSNIVLNIQVSEKMYTLSGFVTENTPSGPIPVADVEVEVEECAQAIDLSFAVAVTDASGLYTIPGMCVGETVVYIVKPGYELVKTFPICDDHGTVCRWATILGDTRLNLELVRQ